MSVTTAPDRTEAAEYYFTYIDKVGPGDICRILEEQLAETLPQLEAISEDRSLHRYAPDKWSIREVLSHLNDGERLFVFRAFWFARGFDAPLPSFDQNVAVSVAGADSRSWRSHVEEFRVIRASTLAFFRNLPSDAWARRGVASGNPVTVRALAYITAGHVTHHMGILKERYL
jgi:DinB superfamily